MDNLCHTLAGAALSRAGLKSRTQLASATLMIASNLPDLDVLVFATDAPSIAFRRGWTHGVLAQATLPLLLAAIMYGVGRWRARSDAGVPLSAGWLVGLSYIGVLLHVAMDLLNNYGVRLLMPFSQRWFYGDSLFIIDPWLWLMLGAGVWLSIRQHASRPARAAVLASALYVTAMVLSARAARVTVADAWTAANRTPPSALMVGPMPVTPFTRQVIIDAGDRYVTGEFSWLSSEVRFDPQAIPKNDRDPRTAAADASRYVAAFLIWSRFPYWTILPMPNGKTEVSVGDMRFFGTFRNRFTVSTVIDH
jgi:inner membrane protein